MALGTTFSLLIDQNRLTCLYYTKKITDQNKNWRLGKEAASIGFILRHMGEIMHYLGTFLQVDTEVENTTMGYSDTGQGANLTASVELLKRGYAQLYRLVEEQPESWWHEMVETPFFGTVERVRLFGHILNHNAHHAGQIALILARHPGKAAR